MGDGQLASAATGMRKVSPLEEFVSASVCADLVQKTREARRFWTDLENCLLSSFFKASGSDDYVLDPFALLSAISEARSNAILVAQLGEASLADVETWARNAAQTATSAL